MARVWQFVEEVAATLAAAVRRPKTWSDCAAGTFVNRLLARVGMDAAPRSWIMPKGCTDP